MGKGIVLYTTSKDLEDIMLTDYPGIIKGDQIRKREIGETKVYAFNDLKLDELNNFLKPYNDIFSYKIFDSDNAKTIENNDLSPTLDVHTYDEELFIKLYDRFNPSDKEYHVDDHPDFPEIMYSLYDVKKKKLLSFLDNIDGIYDYELRNPDGSFFNSKLEIVKNFLN